MTGGRFGRVIRSQKRQNGANGATVVWGAGNSTPSPVILASPAGYESLPMEGDTHMFLPMDGTGGGCVSVGGLMNTDIQAGERRIRALNSDGEVVAWIYWRHDGTIDIISEFDDINIHAKKGHVKINGTDWENHCHDKGTLAGSVVNGAVAITEGTKTGGVSGEVVV